MAVGSDNFADAPDIVIGIPSDPTPNSGLGVETGEPPGYGGHTAWWKFTATADELLVFDTLLSTADTDTALAVYVDDGMGGLTNVAYNEDATDTDYRSLLTLDVTTGTTYYVQVDAYDYAGPCDYVLRVRRTALGDYIDGYDHAYTLNPVTFAKTWTLDESGKNIAPGTGVVFERASTVSTNDNADPGEPPSEAFDEGIFESARISHGGFFAVDGTSRVTHTVNPNPDGFNGYTWYARVYWAQMQLNRRDLEDFYPRDEWSAGAIGIEYEDPDITYTTAEAVFTGNVEATTSEYGPSIAAGPGSFRMYGGTGVPNLSDLQVALLNGQDSAAPGETFTVLDPDVDTEHNFGIAPDFYVEDAYPGFPTMAPFDPPVDDQLFEFWHFKDIGVLFSIGYRTPRVRYLFPVDSQSAPGPRATRATPSLRMLQRGGAGGMSGIPRMVGDPTRRGSLRQGPGSIY